MGLSYRPVENLPYLAPMGKRRVAHLVTITLAFHRLAFRRAGAPVGVLASLRCPRTAQARRRFAIRFLRMRCAPGFQLGQVILLREPPMRFVRRRIISRLLFRMCARSLGGFRCLRYGLDLESGLPRRK